MERSNPYADFGGTVSGTRFIGRERELRIIASKVFGSAAFGSIAVIGLPRIGKTSLVAEAIRRAKSLRIWDRSVVVRTNVGLADSVGSLFRSMIEDLAGGVRRLGLGNDSIEKRVTEALKSQRMGFGEIRTVFKAFRRAAIRPICVLDEFDAGRRVFRNTPQCFHWLREISSNPDFKAAVVLVSKRRLEDVARLAGHDSGNWANVLMTLKLKPFAEDDVESFFNHLSSNQISVSGAERTKVLSLCGNHPYLLDTFGYRAWERVEEGGCIDVEWIEKACGPLVRDYLRQMSTVLEDGPMLSKAVQVIVGPQWDVTIEDVRDLRDFGIVLRTEEGVLRGFSETFEDHLRALERSIDIWPLWRETEQALREVLERCFTDMFGEDWPDALCRARPNQKRVIERCRELRNKERKSFGGRANRSLLAYMYPMQLFELMGTNWTNLGAPLLGSDKQIWAVKFQILTKVRNPIAHNRDAGVSDGERMQASGICQEILELYRKMQRDR